MGIHREVQAEADCGITDVHDVQFSTELYIVGGGKEQTVDRGGATHRVHDRGLQTPGAEWAILLT